MYSTFAPLDPDERLPRELLLKKERFHTEDPGWRHLASFMWPPAVVLTVGLATTRFADISVSVLAAALLFVAFAWFILHRRGV